MMWILVIISFAMNIVFIFGFITVMKGIFRLMDNVDELEERIALLDNQKQNKPLPPPDVVPLERM